MVKCPFCGFDNEDGVLFCEQCKSDVSAVAGADTLPTAAVLDEPPRHAPDEAVGARAQTLPHLDLDLPVAETFPTAEVLGGESYPSAELSRESLPVAEAMPEGSTSGVFGNEAPPRESAETGPSSNDLPPTEMLPVGEKKRHGEAEPTPAPPAPVVATTPVGDIPSAAPSMGVPAYAQPRLKVMRGVKVGVEFPIYPDYNYIGRADEKPVDIDLEDQEPPDRVWCSRQHAVIHFDESTGAITLEDLNSSNGTFVNRTRVYPGEKRDLKPNDVVQIGTVHLKLLV